MLQIKRTVFYKLGLIFLGSIQTHIVRSDVQEAVSAIEAATVEDIIDVVVKNTNHLTEILKKLNGDERKKVGQTIRTQHSNMFSGYFYHNQLSDSEYASLISRFKIVSAENRLKTYMYPLSVLYNVVDITTNKIIDQSYGWYTYAFSHDESLVVHELHESNNPMIVVINTKSNTKWKISYPKSKFLVNNFAFTADNRYLIITSRCYDNQMYVYDLEEQEYCKADEDSFGASLLALNNAFLATNAAGNEILSKIHATTSPCGRYILLMVENQIDDINSDIWLYLYSTQKNPLKVVSIIQHPNIDRLPSVDYSDLQLNFSIHKVCKPGKLSGTFSSDGNFFAIRCQFNVEEHLNESAMVLDERYKPSIISIFESASGKSCFETQINECEKPIAFFKLNDDGSKLVANIEDEKQMIWEFLNLQDREPDLSLDKTLLVYMFAKWYDESGCIKLHTVDTLFIYLEEWFRPISQSFIKQKYNIKPMTHYSRFMENMSSCTIL